MLNFFFWRVRPDCAFTRVGRTVGPTIREERRLSSQWCNSEAISCTYTVVNVWTVSHRHKRNTGPDSRLYGPRHSSDQTPVQLDARLLIATLAFSGGKSCVFPTDFRAQTHKHNPNSTNKFFLNLSPTSTTTRFTSNSTIKRNVEESCYLVIVRKIKTINVAKQWCFIFQNFQISNVHIIFLLIGWQKY